MESPDNSFKTSVLYDLIIDAPEKVIINQGGWRSTKTFTYLQILLIRSAQKAGGIRTIIGRDMPFLKSGPVLDMLRIINSTPGFKNNIKFFNRTDYALYFKNGSMMRFRSYDDPEDAKTTDQDDQYMIEANSIKFGYEIYKQIRGRTTGQVFICYNPTAPFWVHDKLIGQPGVKLIISDHRINPFISQERHDYFEGLKDIDPEFFKVYARGLTGSLQGTVYKNWIPITEFPTDCDYYIWGLDPAKGESKTAGYTAVVKIGIKEPRSVFFKECCYVQGGMDEHTIKDVFINNGWVEGDPIYCDHDPFLIAAIRRVEINSILPAIKGERSELQGIIKVKTFQCYYLPTDVNLNSERSRYRFLQVGDVVTNSIEETKTFHLMAAIRMAIYTRFFSK